MGKLNIYQIYYDESSRQAVQPEFIPLDNTENLRPDWAEYWPISNFLKSNTLVEDDWYGFFSTKFVQKTGLTAQQCIQFFECQQHEKLDVIFFSPLFGHISFFTNVFEQAENAHPGFLCTTKRFFELSGGSLASLDLDKVITHSQNAAYCNYIIAKPAFWRDWLAHNEQLFNMAEDPTSELYYALNGLANYGDHVQKVFIVERMATAMFVSEPWRVQCFDTFALRSISDLFDSFKQELIICNALKLAYVQTGSTTYFDGYLRVRAVIASCF